MLCVDETKLDSSFPDSQFKIDGYTPPPPPSHSYPPLIVETEIITEEETGGKIVFVR